MATVDVQFASFVVGLIVMPIYFQSERPDWNFRGMDTKGVLWAAVAHVCSLSASYFYLRALKTADTSTVTLTTSVYPVVTFILAAFFLGERVTVWKLIGIPVVIFGIWISGRT